MAQSADSDHGVNADAISIISQQRAIAQIAHTLEIADAGEAPFVVIVGAGFSVPLVPMVRDVVRLHIPAWVQARKSGHAEAKTRAEMAVETVPIQRSERESFAGVRYQIAYRKLVETWEQGPSASEFPPFGLAFWKEFYQNNESALKQHGLDFLSANGAIDASLAYQAAFDTELYGALNSTRHAREFQRDLMRPELPRLNEAHLFLALLLGELNQLPGAPSRDRFKKDVALSRVILTTNFDNLLLTALQALYRPHCVSDRLDVELDELDLEDLPYLAHVVYVHGSVHRRSQAADRGSIQRVKERSAKALRPLLRRHGAIVIGYSGWDDVLVDALAACSDCDHHVYWCGIKERPMIPEDLGPKVETILHKGWAHYVHIKNADSFMRDLWLELARPLSGFRADESVRSLGDNMAGQLKIRFETLLPQSLGRSKGSSITESEPPLGNARAANERPSPGEIPVLEAASGMPSAPSEAVAPNPFQGRTPTAWLKSKITEAQVGDTIEIPPGNYRVSLEIDKELTLVGTGKRADARIEASDASAITWRAARGRLANLTLCQTLRNGQPAVDIQRGELLVEDCRIQSDGPGVVVHGAETAAVIKDSKIARCDEGIVIDSRARSTVESTEVAKNRRSGVVIRAGAGSSVIQRSRIHHNGHVGILVFGADGQIEDNDVHDNGREGIMASGDVHPVVKRNRIRNNINAGIYISEGGQGTFEENVIENNQNSGIAIRTRACPLVRKNHIHGNNGKGVWCADGAGGTVQGNDLKENKFGATWPPQNWSIDDRKRDPATRDVTTQFLDNTESS